MFATIFKRLLLLAGALTMLASCSDDDSGLPYGYVYLGGNPYLEEGHLTGTNLHFYGTTTVRDTQSGESYTNREGYIELAGLYDFTLYLHRFRLEAGTWGSEMRLRNVGYTPTGDRSLSFALEEVIPEVLQPNEVGGGATYRPDEELRITQFEGRIDDIDCRMSFTVAGRWQVAYEGRLIGPK